MISITPTAWVSGPITITDTTVGLDDVAYVDLVDPDTDTVILTVDVDSATPTVVVFTPGLGDAPPGVYTLLLRTVTDDEVVVYPASLAVLSEAPPDVPDGVSLTWIDARGAVQFVAGGMATDDTVKMIRPDGTLLSIRGYETSEWHEGSSSGFGVCYEAPLGIDVRFGLAPVSATTWSGDLEATITTPDGQAWLRDLHAPDLSLSVQVASTGDEGRTARQTTHRIVGRARPIVRWDVRQSRQGTITLRIDNGTEVTGWETTLREQLDLLLESGRPLLLSLSHKFGFSHCYMAVGDYRLTRLGKRARWVCELDYVEVDLPDFAALPPAAVTFGEAAQIPPAATFADWAEVRFIDIATRRSA